MAADELLPGVRAAKADEKEFSALLPQINERLAGAGDLSALVEVAQAKMDANDSVTAIGLMRKAIEKSSDATAETDPLGEHANYLVSHNARMLMVKSCWLAR